MMRFYGSNRRWIIKGLTTGLFVFCFVAICVGDTLIHQVNLMRHMLGESYEVTHVDPTAVLLVGKSKSGIPCKIEMTPYQTTIDWQESALVCFEKGWVKVELPAPLTLNRAGRVTFFRDPGNGAQPQFIEP